MMQIVPKWRVMVKPEKGTPLSFSVSERFLGNVLRQLANFDFADELTEPVKLTIEREPETAAVTSVTMLSDQQRGAAEWLAAHPNTGTASNVY